MVPAPEKPVDDAFLQGQIVFEEFLKELIAISQAKANLRMTEIKLRNLQHAGIESKRVIESAAASQPWHACMKV